MARFCLDFGDRVCFAELMLVLEIINQIQTLELDTAVL